MTSSILMLISLVLGALAVTLVFLVVGALVALRIAALFQPQPTRSSVRPSRPAVIGLPKPAYATGRSH